MPASQRHKVRLCRIETQDIAVFCGEDVYSSPFDILLDSGLVHNGWTDFDVLCWSQLGSMSASQRNKVRHCRIEAQEIDVLCGEDLYWRSSCPGDILLDSRLLPNRWMAFDAFCGRLLGSMSASQRNKVRHCRIEAQEIPVFSGEDLYSSRRNTLLDGRLLPNRWTDLDYVCRRLFGSPPASQWYRFHPSAMFFHDVTGSRLGGVSCILTLRGGLNLPVNAYFVRSLRLLMSIMMRVSMWISLYIRTIVLVE